MLDFWKDKKILVTGNTGFKGAWLCEMLLMAGAEVTGYALEPPTDPSLFSVLKLGQRMRSETGDVRDLEHLRKVFSETKPEFVIHMAAQPIVRVSYREPVMTYETNVMGTVNICECVRNSGSVKSFLNVTTDKVYKNTELGTGFVETDLLDGYDPYSNSKSCSELVTHSYTRSFLNDLGIAVSTARAGNVIGGGDFAPDRIIPDCVRAAESGTPIVLRNPDSVRPFQHVLEPLTVYLEILRRQSEDPSLAGAYNVGPDLEDCVRTGELTQLFADAWNRGRKTGAAGQGGGKEEPEFRIEIRPDGGPHEAGFLRLDCTKLKDVFGWQARWHIAEAVERTVEWSRAWIRGGEMTAVTDAQIRAFMTE